MKKLLSLILCAVISAGLLCACDGDDGQNISMKDLPYGSTMRQLVDTEIDICFDGRFFSDDEMKAVSSYYYSIQAQDSELFKSTQEKSYIEYIEKTYGQTLEDVSKGIHDEYAAYLGSSDFEYTYIEAVSCGDAADNTEIDSITELMDSLYADRGSDKTFKETIKSSKYAVLDITAASGETSYTYNNQMIYIFDCEDGIYIFS